MHVIGVAGQMRAGKDCLADYLAEELNEIYPFNHTSRQAIFHPGLDIPYWERASFAVNVKNVFCNTFNKTLEFIEEWKTNPEPPPGFQKNVRKSLQFIGDGFREIQSKIWLDLAFREEYPKIISDARYPNELERIREEGGINILIYREGFLNDDPNGSEALIREYVDECVKLSFASMVLPENFRTHKLLKDVDIFLRNEGTLEQFYKQIDDIVIPYVLEKFPV